MDIRNFFKTTLKQTDSAADQLADIYKTRSLKCMAIGAVAGLGSASMGWNRAPTPIPTFGKAPTNYAQFVITLAAGAIGFAAVTLGCELAYRDIGSAIDKAEKSNVSGAAEFGHNFSPKEIEELRVSCARLLKMYNRVELERQNEANKNGLMA